jgi:transposase-like protein
MTEPTVENQGTAKADQWRERIAEQERRGISVRRFCKEHGLAEHCFYGWRKRLHDRQQPMRFALVQTGRARPESAKEPSLELVLASGERLRIGDGVDTGTLRAVLEVLRA